MRAILLCAVLAVRCYPQGSVGGDAIVYGEARPPEAPALRAETVPASPGSTYVWAAGHWAWSSSGYEWTPGQWVAPPRAGAEWVPARWEERGRHFIWVSGHWR